MLLYVIRHGDPDYANDTLTRKGEKQAQALAERLEQSGIQRVFTSPLGRAIATAKPTCDRLGLSYTIEDWCSETLAWDDFTKPMPDGRTRWVFHQQNTLLRNDQTIHRFDDWYDIDSIRAINGKAGMERIILHSDDFLKRLGYERKGSIYHVLQPNIDRVALFCHQGFTMVWMPHLLQIPPHLFWSGFDVTHTGVTILEFANNKNGLTAPRCLCFSDLSHLYKAGLEMNFNNEIKI